MRELPCHIVVFRIYYGNSFGFWGSEIQGFGLPDVGSGVLGLRGPRGLKGSGFRVWGFGVQVFGVYGLGVQGVGVFGRVL